MSVQYKTFFEGLVQSEAPANQFLMSLGQVTNVGMVTRVEFNEQREENYVAGAVEKDTGGNENKSKRYTNRLIDLVDFNEEWSMTATEVQNNLSNKTIYEDPGFQAEAISYVGSQIITLVKKVRRSAELMSAKILQAGTLPIYKEDGTVLKTEDFAPKGAHFFNAGTAWSGAADIIGDLSIACGLIQTDGKARAVNAIMGEGSWLAALKNTNFKDIFDKRNMNLGMISPELQSTGGIYQGTVAVGSYMLNIWTYPDTYRFIGGSDTKYVPDANVFVIPADSNIRTRFATIPTFGTDGDLSWLNTSLNVGGQEYLITAEKKDSTTIMGNVRARMIAGPLNVDKLVRINTGV